MFVRKKRAAPARRAKRARNAKPKAKAKAGLRLPAGLEQRHLDLIGLFLVAVGVYLVFVLFFGWEGGKVGYGVETGLTYLFGDVGARIFTVLMLLVGGMLLTGTSVSRSGAGDRPRPARHLPRDLRRRRRRGARTVARTHADWREQREAARRGRDRGRADRRDEQLSRRPTSSSRRWRWPRSSSDLRADIERVPSRTTATEDSEDDELEAEPKS